MDEFRPYCVFITKTEEQRDKFAKMEMQVISQKTYDRVNPFDRRTIGIQTYTRNVPDPFKKPTPPKPKREPPGPVCGRMGADGKPICC